MNERIDKLREILVARGDEKSMKLDGYLLINLESSDKQNQRYLTGFGSTLGCLIVLMDRTIFLTDSRYIDAADERLEGVKLEEIESRPVESLASSIKDLDVEALAIDQNALSLGVFNKLNEQLEGVRLVQLDSPLIEIRQQKEQVEIDLIEEAAALTDRSFSHLLDFLEVGITEKEVALRLEFFMRKHGADSVSFPPVVASGEKSALHHARPTDRKIKRGDLLLVDMGATFEGYCSDLTRTISLGSPSEKVKEIYHIVLEAQKRALAKLEPGVDAAMVYQEGSEVIEKSGYGEHFRHALGHGVGLDVHEEPSLSANSESLLKSGMVLTVEPGIYIPGWGGVRIEDLVRVSEDGCSLLSRSPKEEIINPL